MAKSAKALVEPKILGWARKSAGYSTEEVATRLKKPVELIEALERGDKDVHLTMGQLRTLAEFYKRSLSDFYLPVPREERPFPHDFRRLPGEVAGTYSPLLRRELRRARDRRDYALSLYEDLKTELPTIDAEVSLKNDPEKVGEKIRSLLGVSIEDQASWSDGAPAYKAWRQRLGAYGVLVFQFDTLPIDEIWGFSLTERPLPVIAVTVKLPPNGRTFTMLHEFVHVLLQKSAVCDLDEFSMRSPQDLKTEVFCNASAAAALMPKTSFLSHNVVKARSGASVGWTDEEISDGAKDFGASREAFVRRLLTFNRTTRKFYAAKRSLYIAQRAAHRDKQKEKNKGKEMRRSYAERAIYNLDRPFIQTVLRGYHDKHMTLVDAAKLLDVRPEKVRDVETRLSRAR